ncbi:hypothetical protein CENSYa_2031 [Cenarchaeum symbiosum A]|uniref:Antitoxin SocA-like Panacea domain-containing protein n=1 Tax=Cenarchaeum symbiosum (strain A) TaxID=414004 RepID=A0RZ67_CENSY|nr:hypothetical protein CENSYa_2031 [Cenarchaeum symbiosum A]
MGRDPPDVHDAIFLTLHARKGRKNGRRALQKLIYMWSNHISSLEDVDFKPYYFGPYSARLAMAVDEMIAFGFVDETRVKGTHYNKFYTLTEDGKNIAGTAAIEYQREFDGIRRIIDACDRHNSLKSRPVPNVDMLHYMLSDLPGTRADKSPASTIKGARELGWKLTKNGIERGTRLLEELKLG